MPPVPARDRRATGRCCYIFPRLSTSFPSAGRAFPGKLVAFPMNLPAAGLLPDIDVLVVGGGMAGVMAALGASAGGRKVLLVE
ncbi:MAG: dependent oxidoreductase, partial [Verrucomicrobiota bacterium]